MATTIRQYGQSSTTLLSQGDIPRNRFRRMACHGTFFANAILTQDERSGLIWMQEGELEWVGSDAINHALGRLSQGLIIELNERNNQGLRGFSSTCGSELPVAEMLRGAMVSQDPSTKQVQLTVCRGSLVLQGDEEIVQFFRQTAKRIEEEINEHELAQKLVARRPGINASKNMPEQTWPSHTQRSSKQINTHHINEKQHQLDTEMHENFRSITGLRRSTAEYASRSTPSKTTEPIQHDDQDVSMDYSDIEPNSSSAPYDTDLSYDETAQMSVFDSSREETIQGGFWLPIVERDDWQEQSGNLTAEITQVKKSLKVLQRQRRAYRATQKSQRYSLSQPGTTTTNASLDFSPGELPSAARITTVAIPSGYNGGRIPARHRRSSINGPQQTGTSATSELDVPSDSASQLRDDAIVEQDQGSGKLGSRTAGLDSLQYENENQEGQESGRLSAQSESVRDQTNYSTRSNDELVQLCRHLEENMVAVLAEHEAAMALVEATSDHYFAQLEISNETIRRGKAEHLKTKAELEAVRLERDAATKGVEDGEEAEDLGESEQNPQTPSMGQNEDYYAQQLEISNRAIRKLRADLLDAQKDLGLLRAKSNTSSKNTVGSSEDVEANDRPEEAEAQNLVEATRDHYFRQLETSNDAIRSLQEAARRQAILLSDMTSERDVALDQLRDFQTPHKLGVESEVSDKPLEDWATKLLKAAGEKIIMLERLLHNTKADSKALRSAEQPQPHAYEERSDQQQQLSQDQLDTVHPAVHELEQPLPEYQKPITRQSSRITYIIGTSSPEVRRITAAGSLSGHERTRRIRSTDTISYDGSPLSRKRKPGASNNGDASEGKKRGKRK